MNGRPINSSELAELSAYLDGELPSQRAEKISRLLERDDALAAAAEQLRAVDRALDLLEAPAPAADLADRIIAAVEARRKTAVVKIAKYLAPLAAAAMLLAAILFWQPFSHKSATTSSMPADAAQAAPADAKAVEEFARDNLDFFQDYEVVANYETIEAMEALEVRGGT